WTAWPVWPDWRIRCAQPGDVPAAGADADVLPADPMEDVPPVAPNPAFTPSEKLDLTLSVARATARFSGEMAAEPAARATPPMPEATPAAPDWPTEPRL